MTKKRVRKNSQNTNKMWRRWFANFTDFPRILLRRRVCLHLPCLLTRRCSKPYGIFSKSETKNRIKITHNRSKRCTFQKKSYNWSTCIRSPVYFVIIQHYWKKWSKLLQNETPMLIVYIGVKQLQGFIWNNMKRKKFNVFWITRKNSFLYQSVFFSLSCSLKTHCTPSWKGYWMDI